MPLFPVMSLTRVIISGKIRHSLDILELAHVGRGLCEAVCMYVSGEFVLEIKRQVCVLIGSSIRLIAPDTQAAVLWTLNSKPSLLTRVTYEEASSRAAVSGILVNERASAQYLLQ